MTLRPATAALVVVMFAAAGSAAAEDTKRLGKHGEWESYAYAEGGSKVCYAAAAATKVQGGDKGKNGLVVIVTHRAKGANEVSVTGQGAFKKDSDVEMQIGATKHSLFTRADHAWAKDGTADKAIVAAMQKGREITLHATPAKGSAITGSVPLSGFSDALAAIDKACSVKR
ncbi:MAG: invasion associated locus B family protein [Actinomycetota bacterium]